MFLCKVVLSSPKMSCLQACYDPPRWTTAISASQALSNLANGKMWSTGLCDSVLQARETSVYQQVLGHGRRKRIANENRIDNKKKTSEKKQQRRAKIEW